jgi:hypothetical protein
MPADYFSRLPGAKEAVASIAAINPFQADLFHLHMQDEHIQMLQTYMTMNEWPTNLSRQEQTYFKTRKRWFGSDSQISTIPRLLCIFRHDAEKKPCVRLMTVFQGSQRNSQNVPEEDHLLLLAKVDPGH